VTLDIVGKIWTRTLQKYLFYSVGGSIFETDALII